MSITKTKQNKVERNEYSIKGTKKNEMAQWVKSFTTKPGDPRLIPRRHTGEGETNSYKLSSGLCPQAVATPPTSHGNLAHKPWQPRPHTCRDVNKKRTDSLNGPK